MSTLRRDDSHGAMARRLGPKRQTEDLDEADGRSVIECILRFIRGERLVVQRERAAPARHDSVAVIQPDADVTTDDALAAGRVGRAGRGAGR
jgi:hypothetical protein